MSFPVRAFYCPADSVEPSNAQSLSVSTYQHFAPVVGLFVLSDASTACNQCQCLGFGQMQSEHSHIKMEYNAQR